MKHFNPLIVLCALFAAAFLGHAQEPPAFGDDTKLYFNGDVINQGAETMASGGIVISNRNTVFSAERAVVNTDTGEVQADGHITIIGKNHIWEGTNVVYNYKTEKLMVDKFKAAAIPFFINGSGLDGSKTNEIFMARNSTITTDDYENPLYKIRARILIIVPRQYIEAYEATFFLGSVPVFYVPHYKRSITPHPNNYSAQPGYQSSFGAYLLNSYNWYYNENLDGAVHFDWRAKRGLAGGPDFTYHLGKYGEGSFRGYYAYDTEPDADSVITKPLPNNRERVNFFYHVEPDTNLIAKVIARYQSDQQVLRDFFENEYRTNVQPSTLAEVTKIWPNYTLDVLAQPRIVDFYQMTERLPDVKLSAARQQVGVTPVFYEGESSLAYLRRWESSTNDVFSNFRGTRADSFHQFVLPQNYFGWLNVVPRVGGRVTYYSEAYGSQQDTNQQTRTVFNTGVEFSTKASRVWKAPESDFWDVNGLRHIIEPSINYVFVPNPSVNLEQLPQYDYETPSLRLLPIDFPDYNAIDSIDSQNVVRLGIRNKLQTKRTGVENLINWDLYTDVRVDPRDNQQGNLSDLFSDLDLRPRSWLTLNSQLRVNLTNGVTRTALHRITFRPNNTWNFSLGHVYIANNDPEFSPASDTTNFVNGIPFVTQTSGAGNNLFTTSLYYRMNENWGAHIGHRFEARDGMLEEQYYTIYRDLRSWTAALTLRIRHNRPIEASLIPGGSDFTIAFTLSLKSFPRFGLGSDSERPSFLLGD